jgi:hypothetical protein
MAKGVLFSDNNYVQFDVIENEELEKSNLITTKPVEVGFNVTDHAKSNPDSFSFTAHLTDTDAENKYNKLKDMAYSKDICTFSHKNQLFNVLIESLKATADKGNKYGYLIDIQLKQIRISRSEQVRVFEPRYETQSKIQDQAGKKQPNEEEVSEETNSSLLKKIGDKITGWF